MINFIRKFADSLKLHDPVGMRLNPITLSFLDKDMEELFLEDYFNKNLKHIRYALIVAIFIYGIFGIVNVLLTPKFIKLLFLIRYGIGSPILCAVLLFSFSAYFKKYIQIAIAIAIISVGASLITMMMIDPALENAQGSIIFVIMFGYTFSKIRFISGSIAGWVIVVFYEISGIWEFDMLAHNLIYYSSEIITGNIMGMFICYSIEKYARKDFFMSQQLIKANQQEKQRSNELNILNEMSNSLNKCRTERGTYNVIADTSLHLFPDDSGYMMVINNPGTELEKVFSWGDSFDETQFPIRIEIVIERNKTWGIFHLDFPKHDKPGYSDEEYKHKIESKRALAARMIYHYGLFLTNLRLRIIDPLTGLYNRIYIRESLEKEISYYSHCGIIMTDIDDFRNFNHIHGSEAGNMILQKFIVLLKKHMCNQDIICRYGDDEFILIMPELSLSEIGKRAEQLRSEIAEKFNMNYDGKTLNITSSFGVVSFPEHGSNINDVLNAASKALNRAKAGGKNRIVVL